MEMSLQRETSGPKEAAWLKKTDKETLQKEQNDYWIMASLPVRDTSAALDFVSQ